MEDILFISFFLSINNKSKYRFSNRYINNSKKYIKESNIYIHEKKKAEPIGAQGV